MAEPVKVKILGSDTLPVHIADTDNTQVKIAEAVIQPAHYLSGDWISIVNGVISVRQEVTDEFIISDDKVLGINQVSATKVEGIEALIESMMSDLPIATDVIPGLVLSSQSLDSINVLADGTMSINGVNINKVYQDADTELFIYGGDSDI